MQTLLPDKEDPSNRSKDQITRKLTQLSGSVRFLQFYCLLEAPVDSNVHVDVKHIFGRSDCAAFSFFFFPVTSALLRDEAARATTRSIDQ